MGSGIYGNWPSWARKLKQQGVSIAHVLEATTPSWQSGTLAVVGGGLSTAQVALTAAKRGQSVTMFLRRPLRVSEFDTHPRWFRSNELASFLSIRSKTKREGILMRERNPGTLTTSIAQRLASFLGQGPGRITLLTDPINRVSALRAGARFYLPQRTIDVDHVVLATGFEQRLPGADWIGQTARSQGLPLEPSGHPLLDRWLQWAPGLYVCGALAELQIGPTARGLFGGRQASRLIAYHTRNG